MGCSWFNFYNLGLTLVMALKFYRGKNVEKGRKLQAKKFCEPIPMFVEVTVEKLVVGIFSSPNMNRVKKQ